MSIEGQKFYPGDAATADELLQLAREYRQAATHLASTGRRKAPWSLWPYRLAAIQSVELYLDAYLLRNGHRPAQVRAMQHDLDERVRAADKFKLNLKKRTREQLRRITEAREYLIVRYGPEQRGTLSPPNLMQSILDDVANKVEAALSREQK